MQKFRYEALDAAGATQRGTVDSESAEAAASTLAAQNLVPLALTPSGQGMQREIQLPGFRKRTSLKDLAIFARQFASMTSSGLPLLRALAILEDQTPKPKLKEAVGAVRADVEGGITLSKAMARHPEQFPPLMVDMIRAGETGGFLDEALDRIAKMYEADAELRAKIKSAMTYPVIVLAFSLLLGAGVLLFIVPIFEKMFRQLGGNLPLPTKIMVTLSHNFWWLLPLMIVGSLVGMHFYRKGMNTNEAFRLKVDRLKLRLPVFGPLFAKLAIARWSRNLGTLLAVGVPIIQALEVVGGTSGNSVITEAMKDVRESVRKGTRISVPLARHALFPPMVVQMLEVGEETGQITDMLDRVAGFYDSEVKTATDSLTSALEPLLVVLLGAVIGVMVICLYLPMFSIYQNIQTN